MKLDPADPKKVVPDNKVTVIDQGQPARGAATVEAGAGASAVAITPAGNLALAANRSEGTISILSIASRALMHTGKIQGDAKSGPSEVEHSQRDMNAGLRPYPLDNSSRGGCCAWTAAS